MYETIHQPTIAPPALLAEVSALLSGTDKPKIVLSDFDYTLCDAYGRIEASHNHMPIMRPEVVVAARGLHLVVATGRRANHPHLSMLWQSGLLADNAQVIAENGGTLVSWGEHGVEFADVVTGAGADRVKQRGRIALAGLPELPEGQRLIVKEGRTCLVTRLEDERGVVSDNHQTWLEMQLADRVEDENIRIVNARASVVVQHAAIDKGRAFGMYLDRHDLRRADHCIIGMGDAPNDEPLFRVADIRIGFSEAVRQSVDVVAPDGVANTAAILELIKRSDKVA